MPLTQLYPSLVKKNLISSMVPRPYKGPPLRDFDQKLTCDFHYGEVGHAMENCRHLRHRVHYLIDHGVLKFEGLPNITTNPLPNHPKGNVDMIVVGEEDDKFDLAISQVSWKHLFHAMKGQDYLY
jgi:hypothetical protein